MPVETVGNADAALRALKDGPYDLVLSDIVMAGAKNGLDLAREIRAQRPNLPVILATGYSEAAAEAGAEFTLLRKPYDASDLNRALAGLQEKPPRPSTEAKVVAFRDRRGSSTPDRRS